MFQVLNQRRAGDIRMAFRTVPLGNWELIGRRGGHTFTDLPGLFLGQQSSEFEVL